MSSHYFVNYLCIARRTTGLRHFPKIKIKSGFLKATKAQIESSLLGAHSQLLVVKVSDFLRPFHLSIIIEKLEGQEQL